MKALRQASDALQERIASFFRRLSTSIAARPVKTIWICVAVTLCCSVGWVRFSDEDDAQKFLTPQDSRAIRDREFVDDRFEDSPSVSQVFLNRRGDGANVLTKEALLEVFDLHDRILGIQARRTDGYDTRTCALVYWRAQGELPCQREGILAYWDYNRSKLEEDDDVVATVNAGGVDCCSPKSRVLDVSAALAKIRRDGDGRVVAAGAMRLAYYLRQELHRRSRQDPDVDRLERNFDATVRRRDLPSFERPLPLTPAGTEDNVAAAFDFDRLIVTVAFVTISVYAYLATTTRRREHPNKQRGVLGLLAVGCVALAIAAAWGVCFACGVELSPLGTIAAFLVLGIGLDDSFVIVGGIDDDKFATDVEGIIERKDRDDALDAVVSQRIVEAMGLAGPSILTTSATDACAFLAGSYTRIPAISNFCVFAAASVLADFALQCTLFVALLVLTHRRKLRRAVEKLEARVDDERTEDEPTREEAKVVVSPMTPTSWFGRVYAKYVLSTMGMCFVLATTATITTLGAVGSAQVDMEFDYHWFYTDGVGSNYVPRVDRFQRKWFPAQGAGEDSSSSFGLYTKNADYFEERASMQRLIDRFAALSFVRAESFVDSNWFSSHERWLATANLTVDDSDSYLASVRTFLETDEGRSFSSKIVFDGDTGAISATQIDTSWERPPSTRKSIDWMRTSRRRAKDAAPTLRPVVYATVFVWIEGLAIITAETVRSLAIASSVVIVILIALLGDVAVAALVGAFVVSICLCVYGSVYWYGDHINFISAFFIIIAVGLGTDAPAHVAHAYIHAPPVLTSGKTRATYALDKLGSSVWRGGLSTLCGVLVVGLAKTYVFETFFWYLTTIMVLSLWFGLAVAPVTLALVGPCLYSTTPSSANQEAPTSPIDGSTPALSEEPASA